MLYSVIMARVPNQSTWELVEHFLSRFQNNTSLEKSKSCYTDMESEEIFAQELDEFAR